MSESVIEFPDKPAEQTAEAEVIRPLLIVGVGREAFARELVGDKYKVVNKNEVLDMWDVYNRDGQQYGNEALWWPSCLAKSYEASLDVAADLMPMFTLSRVINPLGMPEGWGPEQALKEYAGNWKGFIEWAKPRLTAPSRPVKGELTIHTDRDLPTPSEADAVMWERIGLQCSKGGHPNPHLLNGVRLMESEPDFKGLVWYDTFHARKRTTWNCQGTGKTERDWADNDANQLTLHLQSRYHLWKFNLGLVREVIETVSGRDIRNEAKDWLEGLEWDGKARVDAFAPFYLGALTTPYHVAVGRNFLLSLAARILRPGCQVDTMPILEGTQGAFKTSALRVLGGDWYMSVDAEITDKDFKVALRGKLIGEFQDLHRFRSVKDMNALKGLLTTPADTYRKPYGHEDGTYPRTCVFLGTTNEDEYLRDDTGARRFWPIKCGRINLESLRRDRDQLFAEAYKRVSLGEKWWEVPDEAAEEQESRRAKDEWEALISTYLKTNFMTEATIIQIATNCLGLSDKQIDMNIQKRIATCLRCIKWQKHVLRDETGKNTKTWRQR